MSDLQPNSVLNSALHSTSNVALTPRLRLPQIPPTQVIATRRSIVPVVRLQRFSQTTPLPQAPMRVMMEGEQRPQMPQTPFPVLKNMSYYTAPAVEPPITPIISQVEPPSTLRYPAVTYIPRTMKRQKELSVADALIACATLLLLSLCVVMLLYYLSM